MATDRNGQRPVMGADNPPGTAMAGSLGTATHTYPAHVRTEVHEGSDPASLKRISWQAIIAGAVIALVVQMLLSLLGTGIGLSTIDPAGNGSPDAGKFGMGAGIWWAVSSLISLFAGGWTAGRMAGLPRPKDSMLHGVLVWGLSTLIAAWLLGSAISGIVGATGRAVGTVASGAGQAVSAMAPQIGNEIRDAAQRNGIDLSSLRGEAEKLMRQTGKPELQPEALKDKAEGAADVARGAAQDSGRNPQAADQNFGSLFDRVMGQVKGTASQVDRDALANVVSARTGQSREEARATVDKWSAQADQTRAKLEQQAQEAQQKAREAADVAAKTASQVALWSFFALLIGALAAAFGARAGAPQPDVTVHSRNQPVDRVRA